MSMPEPAVTGLDARAGWRGIVAAIRQDRARSSRIVSGSLIMLAGTSVVSAMNFAYNVAIARLLGPADFGHTTAVGTLLMLVSAITLSFQLVCAKLVAANHTLAGKAEVYRNLRRWAWVVGIALGTLLVAVSSPLSSSLRLPSAGLVIMLAFGIAVYVPLGVRRGGLQGTCAFGRLISSLILEVAVKLAVTLVLVEKGFGVNGAVAALALSVIVAYFYPMRDRLLESQPAGSVPDYLGEGIQAIVFFAGQVLINNIDVVLVKHWFSPHDAGLYAAVSLMGRVVYLASWALISAMFPVSAGQSPADRSSALLAVPLLLVLSVNLVFLLVAFFMPEMLLRVVLGASFAPVAPLLGLYAAATTAYSLSVVLIAFEMSQGIAGTAWLPLLVAGVMIAGIAVFHSALREVVVVQLIARIGLLAAVSVPFLRAKHVAAGVQEAA